MLPADLIGPVAVALARAAETIPAENALPGGALYEMKYDGFRLCAVSRAGGVRVFSRRGVDLFASFPDIVAAAAAHLPRDSVVNGEVVIWHDQRLDFDLLQQRLAAPTSKLSALVARHPASYVVFDLLALRGRDSASGSCVTGERRSRRSPLTGRRRCSFHRRPMTCASRASG